MTRRSGVRGALVPIVTSVVTVAVLVGALWSAVGLVRGRGS